MMFFAPKKLAIFVNGAQPDRQTIPVGWESDPKIPDLVQSAVVHLPVR
tara:strand:+ start:183 stop:326 length:144 start_codon:yes stop_codon:yes gene_type:complete